jgi:hypothetical protein
VDHHPAVEVHVMRGVRHHFTGETVFHPQDVVRVGDVGEKVAVLLVEFFVAVVGDLDDPVLDGKGVRKIFPERVVADLRRPPGEILAIEKRDPRSLSGGEGESGEEKEEGFHFGKSCRGTVDATSRDSTTPVDLSACIENQEKRNLTTDEQDKRR